MTAELVVHERGLWARDRLHFTQTRPGNGDTWAGGIRVPYGPRIVQMVVRDTDGSLINREPAAHAELLALLSDHLDAMTENGVPVLEGPALVYDVTRAAYSLILSDLETGTSIAAWDQMHRLVDRALSWAIQWRHPRFPNAAVTSTWEVF